MYKRTIALLLAIAMTALAHPAEFDEQEFSQYEISGFVDRNSERPRRSLENFPSELDEETPSQLYYIEDVRPRRSLELVPELDDDSYSYYSEDSRAKRSPGGWSLDPSVQRGKDGNTKTNVEVNHKGENHDFNAGWGKVVDGPGKAKPTWHVNGQIRW